MGLPFDFIAGEGPQVERPIGGPEDIDRLKSFEPRDALAHVLQAIRQVQTELAGRVPLIGFAGAPFTLASYAIEGGHSNNFAKTKSVMYGHPEAWHRLCALLADVVSSYLLAQIEAGVNAVQLFDSWVGTLNATDYREFALPHSRRIFDAIAGRVPSIHFGTGTSTILGELRSAGGDVIGADWRIPIDDAWTRIGHDRAIQGNLDPTLLLGPPARMFAQTQDILTRIDGRPGHVFNLGHGLLPSTPVEHVQLLAQYVHSVSRRATA
jgi:uroporphyrinogen decarboxylase